MPDRVPSQPAAALWAELDRSYRRFFAFIVAAQTEFAEQELVHLRAIAAQMRP
jgi:hypothetical protein